MQANQQAAAPHRTASPSPDPAVLLQWVKVERVAPAARKRRRGAGMVGGSHAEGCACWSRSARVPAMPARRVPPCWLTIRPGRRLWRRPRAGSQTGRGPWRWPAIAGGVRREAEEWCWRNDNISGGRLKPAAERPAPRCTTEPTQQPVRLSYRNAHTSLPWPHLHAGLQRIPEAVHLPLLGRAAAGVAVVAKVLDAGGVEAGGAAGWGRGPQQGRHGWGGSRLRMALVKQRMQPNKTTHK